MTEEVYYQPIRHLFDDEFIRRDRQPARGAPAIPGWHSEEEAAQLLGEHIQTRRRKRQLGVGPKWVRHGRVVLYPDGAEEEYLAGLLKRAEAEREAAPVRPRGRPRKIDAAN